MEKLFQTIKETFVRQKEINDEFPVDIKPIENNYRPIPENDLNELFPVSEDIIKEKQISEDYEKRYSAIEDISNITETNVINFQLA